MFNNHTMTLITDLNILGPSINNADFIAIAAITDSDYPKLPNIYNAAILMPPTELLMEWADGNYLILQNEYPSYLSTKDPDDMIIALIAAMTKKNIVLYIPADEFMIYGQMLLNHLYYIYGITCNFMSTQFSINQSKIPFIISKFYLQDIMEAKTYLDLYPANQLLPQWVINKLAEDLHPFNRPATFQEYEQYFNTLNAQKMTNKINMVKIVGK